MRLNFLLAMPRLVQKIGDGYVFPLGMAYVSASLKRAGFNVITLNLNHHEGNLEDILKNTIVTHNINIVGTGGLSPQYHLVKNILKTVKTINPDIITVTGGGIISCQPEVAMEALEYSDYGVVGEGDVTVCEFASTLENGDDMSQVAGLIIKQGPKSFFTTEVRSDITDLNSLPWADYEGFDIDKYLQLPPPAFGGLNSNRMIPMLASRSCPYKCTFCFHSLGARYRRRSLDDFFAELDYLVERYNIEYISMADELFEPKPEYIKAFCERMKPYNIHWHADFAINNVREELLPIMKEAGLDVMFFGLESADDSILASMNKKGLTIKKIETVLKTVQKHDIPVFGAFIFGDIAETVATAQKTMQWWRAHPEYLIHLTLLKPFPGSQIYDYACEKGIIKDKVSYLKDGCPQVNISKMSDAEFAELGRQISESMDSLEKLQDVKMLSLDHIMGRVAIAGRCPACAKSNTYEEVKLFALDYLTCPHCQQKFHIPLPNEVQNNLDNNLKRLLEKYDKVAIWGMTLTVMEMFKHSQILMDSGIFPVDISESKTCINLFGKQVHAPMIINKENITLTIIAVPSHIAQITCQIEENHPGVDNVLDICELVGEQLPEKIVGHKILDEKEPSLVVN
ncbi:MAG: cobalamin-dependent protein [Magnetococcales bacterium]|nr:cobalamin-dependent protein [Magnetococcales bacterium]